MSSTLVDRIMITHKTPINILFDECHGESWSISVDAARQINPKDLNNCSYGSVAEILRDDGYVLDRLITAPITYSILNSIDVLVVAHPTVDKVCRNVGGEPIFIDSEINDIVQWVAKGGSLFVLYEYEADKWSSNINQLLEYFGLKINNDCLIDSYHNIGNSPSIVSFNHIDSRHPILHDVHKVIIYAGATITTRGTAQGVLISDYDAIPMTSPVIACNQYGNGKVLVIGDTDLFDPIRIKDGDHKTLLRNMFKWLSSSHPSIHITRDFKLFSDKTIHTNWKIKNESNSNFQEISISDEISQENFSFSNVRQGDEKYHKSKYSLPTNTAISRFGKCRVTYECDNQLKRSFDIDGVKLNGGSQFIISNADPAFTPMPICPMNYEMCPRMEHISKRFRRHRVFLDIPYGTEYSNFEAEIRSILNCHGFTAVAAKDRARSRILLCNICEEIQSCGFAVADIIGFRGNILYELGIMHALGKPCAILKPKSFDGSMGDIEGLMYIKYESENEIKTELSRWIEEVETY